MLKVSYALGSQVRDGDPNQQAHSSVLACGPLF